MVERSGVDIVMLALARWDGLYSSTAFSLAKQLSLTNRVFYLDNPFTYKDIAQGMTTVQIKSRLQPLFTGKKRYRTIEPGNSNLINVVPKAVYPINFLSRGKVYNYLNKVNDNKVRAAISHITKDFGTKGFILVNCFNPFYLHDVDTVGASCSVYYSVDNMAESKYINKHGIRLEKKVIQNYDVTLATSRELYNYAAKIGDNVHFLPNAVDFDLFQQAFDTRIEKPADIAHIPSSTKIIGYIGHVDHRVDYDLLEQVAHRHSDKIILLIGPISSDDFRRRIASLPNALTIGKKKLEELPAYLKFIDCCIIPFLRNELTSCIYPLKLNEYLAGGKPVVSTRFSPDVNEFDQVVGIADDNEHFIDRINEEILFDNNEKQQERVSKAKGNTWSVRVQEFWDVVSPFL